jgi:cytochrome P450
MAETRTAYEIGGSHPALDWTEDFYQDPHRVYRALRRQGPVHRARLPGGTVGWMVVDYDLAKHVLADPDPSKGLRAPLAEQALVSGNAERLEDFVFQGSMLLPDPPPHTRLRSLVNKAFDGAAINRFGPRVQQIADELLDDLGTTEHSELIRAFAFPLPILAISELPGVPDRDRHGFRSWSTVLTTGASTAERLGRAAAAFISYISNPITERATTPRDDLRRQERAAVIAERGTVFAGWVNNGDAVA